MQINKLKASLRRLFARICPSLFWLGFFIRRIYEGRYYHGQLAIVQMPSGMPVATMAVDGAKNAALFAVQIGAAFNKDLKEQYQQYRKDMAEKVLADNAELQGAIHI